ncbi:hypothetical protein F4809DRAFT_601847 [Biscogniauxia mediterranea]|nr:hypothetical protein F4809DRAFT_601847 [Biscogniauxia mediterranea]
MVVFEPDRFEDGSPSLVQDISGARWDPLYRKPCGFSPDIFSGVMMNLIRNPNINSSWLFRADILFEQDQGQEPQVILSAAAPAPAVAQFIGFHLDKTLVRKLIPRNPNRDAPLDQTCLIYHSQKTGEDLKSLVVYIPHVSSPSDMPFYHPGVRGVAFLHEWNSTSKIGTISIHYHFFDDEVREPELAKLARTGLHLLSTLHKHGEGRKAGYVKRVQHDTIIPQAAVQTTYTKLKEKYARQLIQGWAEVTDPTKHVFEDLAIAAFLIELWAQMYQDTAFPGFVDIGCGNGLLVYILRKEGYSGWGFDARRRKSWDNYSTVPDLYTRDGDVSSLRQHILLPSVVRSASEAEDTKNLVIDGTESAGLIHDGLFPKGTFIISNHADELTPWTPILGAISECPFIMIPCCSHDLAGAKFRAPAPKQQGKSMSAYSSLVEWVTKIAIDCGWEVETEMLRIPSTRNVGLIGRHRVNTSAPIDIQAILAKYGGADGYYNNVIKLVKNAPRGH